MTDSLFGLKSPTVTVNFVTTKEQAEAVLASKIYSALNDNTMSQWNRKAASKHLSKVMRDTAQVAAEHPSDKFCAMLHVEWEAARGTRTGNDVAVELQRCGVSPDALVVER